MHNKNAAFAFSLLILFITTSTLLVAQQVADTLFRPTVGAPAFKEGTGPVVLLDEAHHNFHTLEGRYLPFARVLRKDGYIMKPQKGKFTRTDLDRAKILVIANALAAQNENEWILPTPSALDSAEIATVRSWVSDGGALLLIADHFPFPGSVESLAAEFGILMGNGFAIDEGKNNSLIRFVRSDGSLSDHPITRGRNSSERIDSVVSFTGQAFRLEGSGEALMKLGHNITLLMPQVAWQFSSLTPRISASQMFQGAVVRYNKGRVAVFGEAAMFSAQVSGPARTPTGMNSPAAPQNGQFLLNVLHWLSGLL